MWRCNLCQVVNDEGAVKCVCCETSRHGLADNAIVEKPLFRHVATSSATSPFAAVAGPFVNSAFSFGNKTDFHGKNHESVEVHNAASPRFTFGEESNVAQTPPSLLQQNQAKRNQSTPIVRRTSVTFAPGNGGMQASGKDLTGDLESCPSSDNDGKAAAVGGLRSRSITAAATPIVGVGGRMDMLLETPAPERQEGQENTRDVSGVGARLVKLAKDSAFAGGPGIVYTWGSGEVDQLGLADSVLGEDMVCAAPQKIRRLAARSVTLDIACGALHTVAVLTENRVVSWGCNDDFALGRVTRKHGEDDPLDALGPVGVERLPGEVHVPKELLPIFCNVSKVACGDSHTALITTLGHCFAWGKYKDSSGPIGFPDWSSAKFVVKEVQPVPAVVPLGKSVVATSIASGDNHTVVLTRHVDGGENKVVLWGSNEFGQLCEAVVPDTEYRSVRTSYLELKEKSIHELLRQDTTSHQTSTKSLEGVYAGGATSFFCVHHSSNPGTRVEARYYGAGRNGCGELGIGIADDSCGELREVRKLRGLFLKQLEGGQFFTCGLTEEGHLLAWGRSDCLGMDNLGKENRTAICEPMAVQRLKGKVSSFTAGSDSVLAVSTDGLLFGFGDNQNFQLGLGYEGLSLADKGNGIIPFPTLVNPSFFEYGVVTKIAAGAQHAVAVVVPEPNPVEGEAYRNKVLGGEEQERKKRKRSEMEPEPEESLLDFKRIRVQKVDKLQNCHNLVKEHIPMSAEVESALKMLHSHHEETESTEEAPLSSQPSAAAKQRPVRQARLGLSKAQAAVKGEKASVGTAKAAPSTAGSKTAKNAPASPVVSDEEKAPPGRRRVLRGKPTANSQPVEEPAPAAAPSATSTTKAKNASATSGTTTTASAGKATSRRRQ